MSRLTVVLPEEEFEALKVMSKSSVRIPRDQLRFVLLKALQEEGFLAGTAPHPALSQAKRGESESAAVSDV